MFKLPININKLKQQNPLSKANGFEQLNEIGLADDAIKYLKFIAQMQDMNINKLLDDINKVNNGEIINGIRIVDNVLFLMKNARKSPYFSEGMDRACRL